MNAIGAVSCWLEAEEPQRAPSAAGEALELAAGKDLDPGLVEELSRLAEQASERDADRWLSASSSSERSRSSPE